jgi:hypothetical protein
MEWLAALCSSVLNEGEHLVRQYGEYPTVPRGGGTKDNHDGLIPYLPESDRSSKHDRTNGARLMKKSYEGDPLTCPAKFTEGNPIQQGLSKMPGTDGNHGLS